MIPLNIYLQEALDAGPDAHARQQIERCVIEYGNAIKDMVAANIFPGDMLWKNFGITRHGKVVFYDYDEIEYLTDCNFRRVPAPRNEEDELSGEIWYTVGPRDVFPETFGPFLLGSPQVRDVFMQHHADLPDPAFWQEHKERIQAGHCWMCFRTTRSAGSFTPLPELRAVLTSSHFNSGDFPCLHPPRPHRHRRRGAHPMGAFQGDALRPAAHDLGGGAAIKAAVARAGVAPEKVDEVLFGNCLMAGQGPGARTPGRLQRWPAAQHRRGDAVQDVRRGHGSHHPRARPARGR